MMRMLRMRRHGSRPLDENGLCPLSDLRPGQEAQVSQLGGGHALVNRLVALGFTPGVVVNVLQNFGHGPLIVCVRETRLALGRREASQVLVKVA